MKAIALAHLLGLSSTLASVLPSPSLPGTFVPFESLSSCPQLTPRRHPPSSARDVRPDDFKVIIALGDSISAGFLAKSSPDDLTSTYTPSSESPQKPLEVHDLTTMRSSLNEYCGVAYPIGGDPGALTVANILSHYSPNLTGASTGYRRPPLFARGTVPLEEADGLNAAVSGSLANSMLAQVQDRLLPALDNMNIDKDDWKYVNLAIGANDVCDYCLTPNTTSLSSKHSPQAFASDIKDAVELLRKHVPHVIVNIVGVLHASAMYDLTRKNTLCRGLPIFPRLPLECRCAFLPGPAGDYTRARMDELGEAYDQAVLQVIREWDDENDPSFGATWQPGTVVDLENYPFVSVSPIDCFHPSEAGHQRVAAGFWNRLTFGKKERALPIPWEEIVIRCLEDDDRIQVGARA